MVYCNFVNSIQKWVQYKKKKKTPSTSITKTKPKKKKKEIVTIPGCVKVDIIFVFVFFLDDDDDDDLVMWIVLENRICTYFNNISTATSIWIECHFYYFLDLFPISFFFIRFISYVRICVSNAILTFDHNGHDCLVTRPCKMVCDVRLLKMCSGAKIEMCI